MFVVRWSVSEVCSFPMAMYGDVRVASITQDWCNAVEIKEKRGTHNPELAFSFLLCIASLTNVLCTAKTV